MASDTTLVAVATIPVIVSSISTIWGVRMTQQNDAARDEARQQQEAALHEAKRQDERRHRFRDERVRTAGEYVRAYDDLRRAVRLGSKELDDQDAKARALSDVAGRMVLFFDEAVIAVMRRAEGEIVARHRSNRGLSPELDPEPLRDIELLLIAEMKQQLDT